MKLRSYSLKEGKKLNMRGRFGDLYKICEWIMRLAYVNILWFLFTALGLIIFGFFPATASMFSVIRKWLRKEYDIPVFRLFWNTYRKEFVKLNGFGLIFLVIGIILFIDFRYFQMQSGLFYLVLTYVIGIMGLLYCGALLFFFPIYVHFNLKFKQYLKYSFLIPFSRPLELLFMGTGTVFISFVLHHFPGLIPFFGGSLVGMLLMFYGLRAFEKLQKTKDKQHQDEQTNENQQEAPKLDTKNA